MEKEYKNLLLKDLCGRVPYGVKGYVNGRVVTLQGVNVMDSIVEYDIYCNADISEFTPYLFPLSSMTVEQKIECFRGTPLEIDKYGDISVKDNLYGGCQYTDLEIYLEVIDWLNKNHFDYRGLIKLGLAIDATNLEIY